MEPIISELLAGPKSQDLQAKLGWLLKVHGALQSAPERNLQQIAQPVKQAADLISNAKDGDKDEQFEAELAGLMLQAQGLALYAYLGELNRMRNVIAADVAKMAPGSDNRKKGEQLQSAYEQAIDGLARAYNGLRQAKFEELKNAKDIVVQAQQLANQLRS